MRQEISMEGMVLQKTVLNGDRGYQEVQGQHQNLEGEDFQNSLREADIYAVLNSAKYGLKYQLKGMENQNGTDMYIVEEADAAGKKTTQYYSAKDGLLMKEIETVETPQGAMTMTTEYSDYREVPGSKGYKMPYTMKLPLGPGMFLNTTVQTVEVNKGVDDKEFQ